LFDDLSALVPDGGRVIDVGCGTGKATVALAERIDLGVAVEPDPAMAEICARHLAPFPRWRVDLADFESWDPGLDRSDLVTCAQAWHWLSPEIRALRAHAALTSGGWLAVWWNRTDIDRNPLQKALEAVYSDLAPGMRHRVYGPETVPEPEWWEGFGPSEVHNYRWSATYTTTQWLDLMRSTSEHRMLNEAHREHLLAGVGAVIDRDGGAFDHPYCTTLWLARSD
jgi:trans-aconitate methyltransferase